MLSRLIKHEFRATGRILLPLYALLAVSTALFCVTMRLNSSYDIRALAVFRGLVAFVFGLTIVGAGIVTLALMVYRFYKNYMTDEGYLMFTLPVSTSQMIWSKLIVAMVWSAATALAVLAAGALAVVSQPFWAQELLPDLRLMWDYLFSQITGAQLALYIAELVLLTVFSALSSYLMFYAAIALGHSFANHKVFLSVVFYIAFTMGLQTVASFGGVYGISAAAKNGFFSADPRVWIHSLSLGGVAVAALTAVVFYVVTYFTLKKRLNLQ